jgi:protein-tyrosine phosphatase
MIDVFPLPHFSPGGLAVALRPRGGDWLDDELADFRPRGFTVLVSTLEVEEARELDLLREPEAARAAGLEYLSAPIPDRGVPSLVAARALASTLLARIRSGGHVAVHCRQGIGRSTLTAATVLVASGMSPAAAWEAVAAARGRAVPDTEEQRLWLSSFPVNA